MHCRTDKQIHTDKQRYYFYQKMVIFCKKNAGISKIQRALVPKSIFLKLHMCVYLPTKFEISSKILRRFRQGR